MSRLQDRRAELIRRQSDRRRVAILIGERADPAEWKRQLVVFCRLGRKRRAVEAKMILRGEDVN